VNFTDLIDLAAERLGGAALAANDEFFAGKENLLKPANPVFKEHEYTDRGKWMDGWETRRRRTPGFDWCVIRLGVPGIVRGVIVDTAHFRGNYPEHCSIEGCAVEGHPSPGTHWAEILPQVAVEGDQANPFEIDSPYRYTHVRLNIFPDGGVARLRVHGEPLPDAYRLHGEIDLAAIENGAQALECSDMFFGNRHNLLMPGRAVNMSDGWETKRRRGQGHDWMIVQLAAQGELHRMEVDTSHFKGNAPGTCSLEASDGDSNWREILPQTPLYAHTLHHFDVKGHASHLRFNIFPDGGVSRLHVYGTVTEAGRREAGLRRFNAQLPGPAEALLLECCGAANFARHIRRPAADLHAGANAAFAAFTEADWRQAFLSHPQIGERSGAKWTQQEQAGTLGAASQTLDQLAQLNQAYLARFGYIYIVCATGKSADEMLALLKQRLGNDPATELRVAATEQTKITHLRIDKLLES